MSLACLVALGLAFGQDASGQGGSGFGIEVVDGAVLDADGEGFTQAGGHPHEASVSFDLKTTTDEEGVIVSADGELRNLRLDLPPGLIGNPTAAPTCPGPWALNPRSPSLEDACPASSVVGVAEVLFSDGGSDGSDGSTTFAWKGPVHNMRPPPGVPAQFAFQALGYATFLDADVRSDSDYGLSVRVRSVGQAQTVLASTVTLWGVPADPSHDVQRCLAYPSSIEGLPPEAECTLGPPGTPIGPNPFPTGLPKIPFITNPTSCTPPGVGLETTLHVSSYADSAPGGGPSQSDEASFESHLPPGYPEPPENWGPPQGPTGCEDLPFDPSISVEPTSSEADSPTGLAVDLTVPQHGLENPDGLASAHLKRTVVTLPEGTSISPSAADGLGTCSGEEIGLTSTDPIRFTDEDETCPDHSKIGTVDIETPLLEDPLEGSIYVAEQDENPFGSTFALYLVAKGSGVIVKLPGELSPDPDTGRITATFDDAPQLPFSSFSLRFKGGQRAPLANPPTCGEQTVEAELSPWSAADPDNPTEDEIADRTDTFEIDSGPNGQPCPPSLEERPFDPGMVAGLMNPVAGSTSPFVLQLERPDGHQEISSMEVTPPEGVSAFLRGIPLCSDEDAEAGECGEESRVGQTVVGAGAGSNPYYVDGGEVFLTGPYDTDGPGGEPEAQLGLLIQVPAIAGPFDLGMVNVRAAIHVDPRTAQLHVVSDPIPQVVEGVPLRIRDIRILMDREGFTLAPTDCSETEVTGVAHGTSGAAADVFTRFQVGECGRLDFEPKFRFGADNQGTKRNEHPELAVTLEMPTEEQANVESAEVVLPRRMFVDQNNIANTCTRAQFADDECPDNSIVGHASAESPLLDEPLAGPVYLIASPNPLPDMVADLHGIVDIELFGRIGRPLGEPQSNRIINTFDVVPDVPVSEFELTIAGGSSGILVSGEDVCRKRQFRRVDTSLTAHNGSTLERSYKIKSQRCDRIRAQELTQRANQLRKRARRAARHGSRQKAKRLRAKARRLEALADQLRG